MESYIQGLFSCYGFYHRSSRYFTDTLFNRNLYKLKSLEYNIEEVDEFLQIEIITMSVTFYF